MEGSSGSGVPERSRGEHLGVGVGDDGEREGGRNAERRSGEEKKSRDTRAERGRRRRCARLSRRWRCLEHSRACPSGVPLAARVWPLAPKSFARLRPRPAPLRAALPPRAPAAGAAHRALHAPRTFAVSPRGPASLARRTTAPLSECAAPPHPVLCGLSPTTQRPPHTHTHKTHRAVAGGSGRVLPATGFRQKPGRGSGGVVVTT